MTTITRIRPRAWPGRRPLPELPAAPARRWWKPLSLMFRALRLRPRTEPAAARPGAPPAAHAPVTHVHRAHETHLHEGPRVTVSRFEAGRLAAAALRIQWAQGNHAEAPRLALPPRNPDLRIVREMRVASAVRTLVRNETIRETHVTGGRDVFRSWKTEKVLLGGGDARQSRFRHIEESAPQSPTVRLTRIVGTLDAPVFSPRARVTDRPRAVRPEVSSLRDDRVEPRLSRSTQSNQADRVEQTMAAAIRRDAVPLEWRSRAPIAAVPESADATIRPKGTPSNPSPPAAITVATEPATRVAPIAPAAPPPKIEGPALDRLAEDVMQRIERRVRIERERRGIY